MAGADNHPPCRADTIFKFKKGLWYMMPCMDYKGSMLAMRSVQNKIFRLRAVPRGVWFAAVRELGTSKGNRCRYSYDPYDCSL